MKNCLYPRYRCLTLFWCVWLLAWPVAAVNAVLLGWNNLGMHCMDRDYSVFSILPPYNTVEAQLIIDGHLVTSGTDYTLSYQAVTDPDNSINSTSVGKGNFYSYVAVVYGATLAPDVGLAGWNMPGANNTPQDLVFDTTNTFAPVNWFRAEGIPITPYDDAGQRNPYPLMRLSARDRAGNVVATSPIVLPVSDEMDCRACHASSSAAAARPAAGWINDPNPERDYRLNILRLHDERRDPATWPGILSSNGFNAQGLLASVLTDQKPPLCAKCHLSEALPGTGFGAIPPLTRSVHALHAAVVDPATGVTLDSVQNRSACYRCHPGSTTRCLRGAMRAAVAADGSLAMQCQSCHGTMSQVGAANRTGWLMEPVCQSCHTGTATSNNGQIRYLSAFDANGQARKAVDSTFATQVNTPVAGLSLYRFSAGHGGLQCAACHGSTHAEFPSTHLNDNLRNIQLQGHAGVMAECTVCHVTQPDTITGGPHGMHPIGQTWANRHGDLFEHGAASPEQCQACHGADYRGTVLSRAQADRSLVGGSENGTVTVQFFRGAQVGCYNCHQGPYNGDMNNSPAPTVGNLSTNTALGQPVGMLLPANGANLTVRVVSQPAHGTVGLQNRLATYFPEPGFSGVDSFTFAAFDGSKNSTLGVGTVAVGPVQDLASPTIRIVSPTSGSTWNAAATQCTLTGSSADNVGVVTVTWTNDRGGSGTATGTTQWTIASLALQPGVNLVTVTAHDAANNTASDTLAITYSTADAVTVLIAGSGTVTPNLNGKRLQAGKSYTLTARPAAGYLFASWTGSVLASTPTISFVAETNMVLQANFVPNPFLPVKGTYVGLFYEPDNVVLDSAGSFTLTLTDNGRYTGLVQMGLNRLTVSGQFDATGKSTKSLPRRSQSTLTMQMALDLSNPANQLTGTVGDGTWTAALVGDRLVYSVRTNPAPQVGSYNLVIPGNLSASDLPGGDGYGSVKIGKAGQASLTGTLADATKIAQAGTLTQHGQWPFYLSLYGGRGFVLGWLAFTGPPTDELNGSLSWSKPAQPGAKTLPAGFNFSTLAAGARYAVPPIGGKALGFTEGQLVLQGAYLTQNMTNHILIGANNRITNLSSNRLSLTIQSATGLFSGGVVHPITGKQLSFHGALVQGQGQGYFLDADRSGAVTLEAWP